MSTLSTKNILVIEQRSRGMCARGRVLACDFSQSRRPIGLVLPMKYHCNRGEIYVPLPPGMSSSLSQRLYKVTLDLLIITRRRPRRHLLLTLVLDLLVLLALVLVLDLLVLLALVLVLHLLVLPALVLLLLALAIDLRSFFSCPPSSSSSCSCP